MTNTFSESAVYFIATYKISITCRISDNSWSLLGTVKYCGGDKMDICT